MEDGPSVRVAVPEGAVEIDVLFGVAGVFEVGAVPNICLWRGFV